MSLKAVRKITVVLVGGMAALAVSSCAGNFTGNETIAQALGQLAQGASQIPALNQMTVNDLVAGFQQFVDQVGQGQRMGPMASLTADQQQQIQDLQAQLDAGQITQQQFADKVHSIIGDALPADAFVGFGFMGGPFAQGPQSQMADPLNLTDAQEQQAKDIFTRLHDDVKKLRQDAHDKIIAVLTPDQQTTLNGLVPDQPAGFGMHGRGMGMRAGGVHRLTQDLATALQLTDAQKTQIDQIRTDLRTAVQARHQQARDEFRAILTADQQAILDKLEQGAPATPPGSSDYGPVMRPAIGAACEAEPRP